jgi:PRC-barrel domain protein
MLHGIRELYGFSIAAVGGDIGRVRDAYFHDRQWPLRYVVVDTGRWPDGRQIFISPRSVTRIDRDRKRLHTTVTEAQLAERPGGGDAGVVSYRSAGWPRCPLRGDFAADVPYPASAGIPCALTALADKICDEQPEVGDPHLRSTRSVSHHYVHALDGDVGHVVDFLYEETSWRIRYVVAATGSWWPGRKVLIPVGYVSWLSWDAHTLNVQVPRETIQLAPSYHAGQPATDEYLARLAVHYASSPA